MSVETDQLYDRYKTMYTLGALDDPVLARAFKEAQPNRELQAELDTANARTRAAEEQAAAAEARTRSQAESHAALLEQREDTHNKALRALRAQVRELQRAQPKPPVKVRYVAGEKKTLDELGWVKNAGS